MAKDLRNTKKRGTPQRQPQQGQNGGQRSGVGGPTPTFQAISDLNQKFDKFTDMFGQFLNTMQGRGSTQQTEARPQGSIGDATLTGEPDHRFRENRPIEEKATIAGEPDRRFVENRGEAHDQHVTLEGKPDERFAENRQPKEPLPDVVRETAGPKRGNYSGNQEDQEGRHYTKIGQPDHRFREFRGTEEEEQQRQSQRVPVGPGYTGSAVRAPFSEREMSGGEQQQHGGFTEEDPNNQGNIRQIHQQEGGKIELNRVTVDDLMNIPMMGRKRAESIISFRDRNQGFQTWDDVEGIPGISKGMLANLQEHCAVNGQTIDDYLESVEQEGGDEQEEGRFAGHRLGGQPARRGRPPGRRSNAPPPQSQSFSGSGNNVEALVQGLVSSLTNVSDQEKAQVLDVLKRGSSRPPTNRA